MEAVKRQAEKTDRVSTQIIVHTGGYYDYEINLVVEQTIDNWVKGGFGDGDDLGYL
jgi:hypothetical protein